MWPQDVTRDDLRIEFMRGSGDGGQNRNKRDTACRITHIPTGINARSEDQRTQHQNKKMAFKRLGERLIPLMVAAAKGPKVEPSKEIIRHYRDSDGKVRDKRLPNREFKYDEVIYKNGLDDIIKEIANKL